MNRRSFIEFFYERCPDCCYTRWWHGLAYHDIMRQKNVMVIYPFHWAVQFAWWLNMKWNQHRGKPSWIDELTIEAYRKGRNE